MAINGADSSDSKGFTRKLSQVVAVIVHLDLNADYCTIKKGFQGSFDTLSSIKLYTTDSTTTERTSLLCTGRPIFDINIYQKMLNIQSHNSMLWC